MPVIQRGSCTLSYELAGAGPPALFIQGVGVCGSGWGPQVDALSPKWTCLTFDNRGIGESGPVGPGPLTLDTMVDDALALADAQGWGDMHVVGHSMGGHIAIALALAQPQRVRSLALLCTSARGRDMPPVTARFLWTSLRSRIGTQRARRHAFLEIVLPQALLAAGDLDGWAMLLEPLFGHDLADTPTVAMKQIGAYRALDATAGLGRLAGVPTLVVGATEDPLSPPRVSRALAAGIPGARFIQIEGAAHGVTITHAAAVNQLLADHFAEPDRARV